jgi:hypothetical protein
MGQALEVDVATGLGAQLLGRLNLDTKRFGARGIQERTASALDAALAPLWAMDTSGKTNLRLSFEGNRLTFETS